LDPWLRHYWSRTVTAEDVEKDSSDLGLIAGDKASVIFGIQELCDGKG